MKAWQLCISLLLIVIGRTIQQTSAQTINTSNQSSSIPIIQQIYQPNQNGQTSSAIYLNPNQQSVPNTTLVASYNPQNGLFLQNQVPTNPIVDTDTSFISNSALKNRKLVNIPTDLKTLTDIFRINKFFCLNHDESAKKLCKSFCTNIEAPICKSCITDTKKFTTTSCTKANFSAKDKAILDEFNSNLRLCTSVKKSCGSLCKKHMCKGDDKETDECVDCPNKCIKMSEPICTSTNKIISKYEKNAKKDAIKHKTLIESCELNCKEKCVGRRGSMECMTCQSDCSSKSGALSSKKNRFTIISLFNCKDNCKNGVCKKPHQKNHKNENICELCNNKCDQAAKKAQLKPIGIDLIYFRELKYRCVNINASCDRQCNEKCLAGLDSEVCMICIRECRYTGEDFCKSVGLHHFGVHFYKHFAHHTHTCLDIGGNCNHECGKDHCWHHRRNSHNCHLCLKECAEGAKASCPMKEDDFGRKQQQFPVIYHYFHKKKHDLHCVNCLHERRSYCALKCGVNYKCQIDCDSGSENACMSNCIGNYNIYYYNKFFNTYSRQFKTHIIKCSDCAFECKNSCNKKCHDIDTRCHNMCNRFCGINCHKISCNEGVEDEQIILERENAVKIILQKLEIDISRFNINQTIRTEYDEMIEKAFRSQTFRENRDSVIKSVELEEAIIFEEDADLVQRQRAKSLRYEQRLFGKLMKIYSNQETYEHNKMFIEDVFED